MLTHRDSVSLQVCFLLVLLAGYFFTLTVEFVFGIRNQFSSLVVNRRLQKEIRICHVN